MALLEINQDCLSEIAKWFCRIDWTQMRSVNRSCLRWMEIVPEPPKMDDYAALKYLFRWFSTEGAVELLLSNEELLIHRNIAMFTYFLGVDQIKRILPVSDSVMFCKDRSWVQRHNCLPTASKLQVNDIIKIRKQITACMACDAVDGLLRIAWKRNDLEFLRWLCQQGYNPRVRVSGFYTHEVYGYGVRYQKWDLLSMLGMPEKNDGTSIGRMWYHAAKNLDAVEKLGRFYAQEERQLFRGAMDYGNYALFCSMAASMTLDNLYYAVNMYAGVKIVRKKRFEYLRAIVARIGTVVRGFNPFVFAIDEESVETLLKMGFQWVGESGNSHHLEQTHGLYPPSRGIDFTKYFNGLQNWSDLAYGCEINTFRMLAKMCGPGVPMCNVNWRTFNFTAAHVDALVENGIAITNRIGSIRDKISTYLFAVTKDIELTEPEMREAIDTINRGYLLEAAIELMEGVLQAEHDALKSRTWIIKHCCSTHVKNFLHGRGFAVPKCVLLHAVCDNTIDVAMPMIRDSGQQFVLDEYLLVKLIDQGRIDGLIELLQLPNVTAKTSKPFKLTRRFRDRWFVDTLQDYGL